MDPDSVIEWMTNSFVDAIFSRWKQADENETGDDELLIVSMGTLGIGKHYIHTNCNRAHARVVFNVDAHPDHDKMFVEVFAFRLWEIVNARIRTGRADYVFDTSIDGGQFRDQYKFGIACAMTKNHFSFVFQFKPWDTCASMLCLNKATKTCGRCNKMKYCSVACQKENWSSMHKKMCNHLSTI